MSKNFSKNYGITRPKNLVEANQKFYIFISHSQFYLMRLTAGSSSIVACLGRMSVALDHLKEVKFDGIDDAAKEQLAEEIKQINKEDIKYGRCLEQSTN